MLVSAQEAGWALAMVFRGAASPAPNLAGLREDSLKQAFRRRARDTHPDRAISSGRSEQDLARDFRDLRRAYETLLTWLGQRRMVPPPAHQRPSPAGPATATKAQAPPPPAPEAQRRHHGAGAQRRHRAERPQAQTRATPPPHPGPELGNLPRRPLLLAEFLHLSGLVSWQDRIGAIVWQRRQRPSMGQLATRWGYLNQSQVTALLRNRQPGERFGETAERHGLLSTFQVQVLICAQRRSQQPIGAYFIEQRLLSPLALERALSAFNTHNQRYQSSNRRA